MQATFWLLNGQNSWRSDHTDGISVYNGADLSLAANPNGPLSLWSRDGSLGGLTMPRGFALDGDNTLYLLRQGKARILRFEPASGHFVTLPTLGGVGSEARRFRYPANIAIAGPNLYVVDQGNRRVQVFDLASLVLRYIWGPWNEAGQTTTRTIPGVWKPLDLASWHGQAYLLDRRYGRVYRHQPGQDQLELVLDQPEAAGRWRRLALDREGRIYLLRLERGRPWLDIYHSQNYFLETVAEAGEVRTRFDPPPLRLSYQQGERRGIFCLPESLARLCARSLPESPPEPEQPMALCRSAASPRFFDREGHPVMPSPVEEAPAYQVEGTWISEGLDSQVYNCQWHRIELELGWLPAGTALEISTYSSGQRQPGTTIPGHLWQPCFKLVGEMQPPPKKAKESSQPWHEFLVRSHPGQYLSVRLTLYSDGYATPLVKTLRVHYPRKSYLDYLPAVYQADEASRRFLEQFLSIFQTEWDSLEQRIEAIAAYFDPAAVPDDFLAYLAGWLDLPLEGSWNATQKRRLLMAMRSITPRRGTLQGVRDFLRVYLENLTEFSAEEQGDYPQLVEGFRERQPALLDDSLTLNQAGALWSAGVVSRLQLGVFDREGEVRLVSTGDPVHDVFNEYAHRFRVFIPAAWVRSADDERMVRRALDAEKPAHTQYDLCLIEPRLRVGLQARVGLDTIVGAYPQAHLACPHEAETAPPSRWPRSRLGYDTILAEGKTASLGPGQRVRIDRLLI